MTTTNTASSVDSELMIDSWSNPPQSSLLPVEVRPDGSIRAFCPHANHHFSCGRTDSVRELTEVLSHVSCVDDCPILRTGFRADIVGPIGSVPLPAKRRTLYHDRFGRCLSGLLRAERRAGNPKRRS